MDSSLWAFISYWALEILGSSLLWFIILPLSFTLLNLKELIRPKRKEKGVSFKLPLITVFIVWFVTNLPTWAYFSSNHSLDPMLIFYICAGLAILFYLPLRFAKRLPWALAVIYITAFSGSAATGFTFFALMVFEGNFIEIPLFTSILLLCAFAVKDIVLRYKKRYDVKEVSPCQ